MLVSIIIATRNRCAALNDTLLALARVRIPDGFAVELLVVDNGSGDETPSCLAGAARSWPVIRQLNEPTRGKSFALNTGLAAARGEIIAFLDDDVRPDPEWLDGLIRPIADRQADAIAGKVRIAPHLRREWMTPLHLAWLACTHELDRSRPPAAVGANMAVGRNVLRLVPGFNPELGPGRLGLWEDTLFSHQILRAGYRLRFAAGAEVEHHFDPERLTRSSFLAHARRQGRSAAYCARHWDHAPSGPVSRLALRYRLRLFAKNFLRCREPIPAEGIAAWEMNLTCGIAFAAQFQIERRRPPAYPIFSTPRLVLG